MNKLLLLAAAAVLVAVPVLATDFVTFEPLADCEGYSLDFSVHYASYLDSATLESVITATDADGIVVATLTETTLLEFGCPDNICSYSLAGAFEPALEGGLFTIEGVFTLTDVWNTPSRTFVTEVTCGEPPSGWCPRTPGYWKNHAENWPVSSLTVGGVELTQDEALEIFRAPVRGDTTVILAKHLMAAMLNLAMGADDLVSDTVADANAFLVDNPVFSRPRGADKQEALGYKDILADWNETECSEGDDGDDEDKSMAYESATWSTVKEIFR